MANDLKVMIEQIEVDRKGNIMVFLFSEKGFPKKHEHALKEIVVPADKESIEITFSEVPKEFAVKVLHDEDENGKVTKNWTGIVPREGLGFSNDQTLGTFGPPSYDDCKIKRPEADNKVVLKVIYP